MDEFQREITTATALDAAARIWLIFGGSPEPTCFRWAAEAALARAADEVGAVREPPLSAALARRNALGYGCGWPDCGADADEVHHRRTRTQGGGDEPGNLVGLCLEHHRYVHSIDGADEAELYGLLVPRP